MTSPVCVAFQGGGALGMAHLGAWQELARRFDIVGAAGTSAGAIVAALCAASYTPTHAIDLFNDLQWPAFVQRQGLFELFRKQDAWSDGEQFYQWLRGHIGAYLATENRHPNDEKRVKSNPKETNAT
jgi:predicted acylesterase/phospholipase RssA